jgi:carbonic anhydrase
MTGRSWEETVSSESHPRIAESLQELWLGHERFREQAPRNQSYSESELRHIAENQQPMAAIVACSDSRVAPEILFDQPLGGIFVSRVPGNVASDSAKWMLDIAVTELKVPLVLVLGHTGCLAIGQLLAGRVSSAGGTLRFDVQKAVHRARMGGSEGVFDRAVIENVRLTMENLRRDSFAVQRAIERGELGLYGGYYQMDLGEVRLLGDGG